MHERYSWAYMLRAEDEVELKAFPGCLVPPLLAAVETPGPRTQTQIFTSREWLNRKFGALRQNGPEDTAEAQRVRTGHV